MARSWVAAAIGLVALAACSPEPVADSSPPTTSIALSTTEPVQATTTTGVPSTTSSVVTSPTPPPFGSPDWISSVFTVNPAVGTGFSNSYTVGEPRHVQIVVADAPTELWIWAATYETPRIIVVGEGRGPYLRTISEEEGDNQATTTTAPDPAVTHDVMIWSIIGGGPTGWKIRDSLVLRLPSTFLAKHKPHGDCFEDVFWATPAISNLLGFIDPDEWNVETTEDGLFGSASDIQPRLVFDTGIGGELELLDPALVTCRILY